MTWPNNADGDVLRRLESQGFNFSEPCWVDFNVDFEDWPPPDEVIGQIGLRFPDAVVEVQEDGGGGYLLVRIFDKLTYGMVIHVQAVLSEAALPFGGHCESWGVLH